MRTYFKDRFSLSIKTRDAKLFTPVVGFLLLIAISLTLSPAAQARSFQADYRWQHWIGFLFWLISMVSLIAALKRNHLSNSPVLLPVIALLTGWGLMTVWRLSPSLGIKQTIWLATGTTAVIILLPHGQRVLAGLRRYKYIWLTSGLLLTALTLIFGTNPAGIGPRLWLGCCGIYFQPSEPLKLLLILFLAAYFADRQPFTRGLLPLILPTLLVSGLTFLILIIQRDLGTAAIIMFIYTSMLYIATGNRRILLISLLGFIAAAVLGYFLFDVVQLRYEAWINPWLDPSGGSYQIVQSLIAIASGGVSGRGPGMGYPTLVPISFSDFIFTSVAEEFGLPGTIGLIITIALLTAQALSIGLKAPNRHKRYLAAGIASFVGAQSILIIGGNIRLLPLTGVTLPLFSYGGSSLITSLISLYLLIVINNSPSTAPPNSTKAGPVFQLSALMFVGFAALSLVNGWWAVVRGPDLLTRTDNARRTISDRYIERGRILDRKGTPLSLSSGTTGELTRQYTFSEAAHVVGYTNPFFGQSGAESTLDPILRGLENQSPWTVWFNHLVYGQPPPGLDARISIDIGLQSTAAELFGNAIGTVVLLDANSGEILVMYSSPAFDANTLEDDWDQLLENPDAPLINRATQGLYPPGPILAPFYLAQTQTTGPLPSSIISLDLESGNSIYSCTKEVPLPATWEQSAAAGCPAPLEEFGVLLNEEGLLSLFENLDFYKTPEIRLDAAEAFVPPGLPTPTVSAIGQADILITPLQLAIAATTITNQGKISVPNFLLEVESPEGTWINVQKTENGDQVFVTSAADQTTRNLTSNLLPIWEVQSYSVTGTGQKLTWYMGGTLPDSENGDFSVVVLLEEPNPPLAAEIGQQLLILVTTP